METSDGAVGRVQAAKIVVKGRTSLQTRKKRFAAIVKTLLALQKLCKLWSTLCVMRATSSFAIDCFQEIKYFTEPFVLKRVLVKYFWKHEWSFNVILEVEDIFCDTNNGASTRRIVVWLCAVQLCAVTAMRYCCTAVSGKSEAGSKEVR